ncbi:40S ribosomal protein s15a [Phtheirospermum japonicum]|uniref:40S ribosomal protein s15a n=1 Tax=Phtheirospermum japonicum TaxID=374723 RepID=A0A830CVE7_9LAMI|nr:40S ribosomal protein s15a [Phtheirospermum japonicum]
MVIQKHGYISEFEYVDDHRSGKIVVELNERLNKCGIISPRFDVGVKKSSLGLLICKYLYVIFMCFCIVCCVLLGCLGLSFYRFSSF